MLHLHGKERLEEETSCLFNLLLHKNGATNPTNFRGFCIKDIDTLEEIVQASIFLYHTEIVDGFLIGELLSKNVGKYSNTEQLFLFYSLSCYVSNITALFKAYRFPSSDQFVERAHDLERHLTTCKEGIKHVFAKNVYQLQRKNLTN